MSQTARRYQPTYTQKMDRSHPHLSACMDGFYCQTFDAGLHDFAFTVSESICGVGVKTSNRREGVENAELFLAKPLKARIGRSGEAGDVPTTVLRGTIVNRTKYC